MNLTDFDTILWCFPSLQPAAGIFWYFVFQKRISLQLSVTFLKISRKCLKYVNQKNPPNPKYFGNILGFTLKIHCFQKSGLSFVLLTFSFRSLAFFSVFWSCFEQSVLKIQRLQYFMDSVSRTSFRSLQVWRLTLLLPVQKNNLISALRLLTS